MIKSTAGGVWASVSIGSWRAFVLPLVLLIPAATARGQSRAPDSTRLLFTGDILLTRQVDVELKSSMRSPWADFQKLFRSSDWVTGNFEGSIGPSQFCIASKSPCLATPESAAQLLERAGFHALVTENNHAGDLGKAGREQTRKVLQHADLVPVDFEQSPYFFHLHGTEIALLAITLVRAADGRVQAIPSDEVRAKLRLARMRAGLVIVSVHWGNEFMEWPSTSQREKAAWLVEQGADLVIGHHPHVIQRPECIGGKPVFFSLGNHLFDQANPKTKRGMIADCRVRGDRLRCRSMQTISHPGSTIPVLNGPDQRSDSTLAACTPYLKPEPTN